MKIRIDDPICKNIEIAFDEGHYRNQADYYIGETMKLSDLIEKYLSYRSNERDINGIINHLEASLQSLKDRNKKGGEGNEQIR